MFAKDFVPGTLCLPIPILLVTRSESQALEEGTEALIMATHRLWNHMAAEPTIEFMERWQQCLSAPKEQDLVDAVLAHCKVDPAEARDAAKAIIDIWHDRMQEVSTSLGALDALLKDAQDSVTATVRDAEEKVEKAEGRFRFMEGLANGLIGNVEKRLREELASERAQVKELEAKVYRPDVQAVLAEARLKQPRQHKKNRVYLSDKFDAARTGTNVMSLDAASHFLGKTRPAELTEQAEMLAGQAAELAGTEDAEVIRIKAKLRLQSNTRFFNQWYNLISWRSLSKVVKDGTIPFLPNKKPSISHHQKQRSSPERVRKDDSHHRVRYETNTQSAHSSSPPKTEGVASPSLSFRAKKSPRTLRKHGVDEEVTLKEAQKEVHRSFVAELQYVQKQNEELHEELRQVKQELKLANEGLASIEKVASEEIKIWSDKHGEMMEQRSRDQALIAGLLSALKANGVDVPPIHAEDAESFQEGEHLTINTPESVSKPPTPLLEEQER
eukprot:CAMPEP_0184326432 /NCGR_PEP_ID=MMETSP1049-20130417/142562_1 /TAXON_ID=77928 /ORGANISM="Proteomonas sulcata, Strain CCMP704" /LENGTH=498 /DNA_ID=CAMNT_0026648629 /DNA_START=44 /DNA_END=1540 /DNA_ORIENTATION=+